MPKKLNERPLVIAHQGASAYAPDNTLPSFALAAEMGADGVELDVHLTADGQIVVCHDETIRRTSDFRKIAPEGTDDRIAKMTLDELRKYNFAFKFFDKGEYVPIPTLDEVYELLAPLGLSVNVEIKGNQNGLVEALASCAEKYNMQDKVIYSSFTYSRLWEMQVLGRPAVRTAPLSHLNLEKSWEFASRLGCMAVHPHFESLLRDPDYVRKCHDLGLRVHPWTVDNPEIIGKLLDMDADAIITNVPDVCLAVIKNRNL